MAKYVVVAPDKESLSIAGVYGSQKFAHGSFIYDDNLAKAFPQFFVRMPDEKPKMEKKEVKPEAPKKDVVESSVPKKKAGRPKKKG